MRSTELLSVLLCASYLVIIPGTMCTDMAESRETTTTDDPRFQISKTKLGFQKAIDSCKNQSKTLYYPNTLDESLPQLTEKNIKGNEHYWVDGKRPCGKHSQWATEEGGSDGCLVVRELEKSIVFYSTSCENKFQALCYGGIMSSSLMSIKNAYRWCSLSGEDRKVYDKELAEKKDDEYLLPETDLSEVSIDDDNSILFKAKTVNYPVTVLPDQIKNKTYWVDHTKSCGKTFPFFNSEGKDISEALANKWFTSTDDEMRIDYTYCLYTWNDNGKYVFSSLHFCYPEVKDRDDEFKKLALCSDSQVSDNAMDIRAARQWCKDQNSTLYYPSSATDTVPGPVKEDIFLGIKHLFEKTVSYWTDVSRAENSTQWLTSDGQDVTAFLTNRWYVSSQPDLIQDHHCLRAVLNLPKSITQVVTRTCENADWSGSFALCMS